MGLIQARAKLINGDGRVYVGDSNVLSVNTSGVMGDWDYEDLTLEYQAGYAGGYCEIYLFSPSTDEEAQLKDIIINDPNGVVTVTNSKAGTNTIVKITSTGRAGLVSFRFPAKFNKLTFWNYINDVVSGYPALKGFRSFGNTLRQVIIRISYSYEIPVNIPSTLKIIQFGFAFGLGSAGDGLGSTKFNDPKISHWDVSNLEAESFQEMFANCTNFNQDLSRWCVSQVTSPPIYFSVGSALTPANHPVWGTCPSTASVSGYSVRNSPGGANDNYVATFDNIGANDWIYISFSLLAVKQNDIISWGVPPGDYLNSNGNVDKATIYQLPSQAVVNGTNSIVFNQAASSALVTWRMDEAFQRSIANRQGYIILYINGIEKLRITVFVRGDR